MAIISNNPNIIAKIKPKTTVIFTMPLNVTRELNIPIISTIKGIIRYTMLTTSTLRPSINKPTKSSNSGRSSTPARVDFIILKT